MLRNASRLAASFVVFLFVGPSTGVAQEFPTKTVRIIVTFPPGGENDAVTRLVAQKATDIWGRPVIVDFRAGAAGNIGADLVVKAPPDGHTLLLPRLTQVDARTSAPLLHQFMTDRFPQLTGFRVTHAWTGNVAFSFDGMPHTGRRDGLYYCLGCNGSGVAMMTNLGYQTARKMAGVTDYRCSFDSPEFPGHPFYSGSPWFLPVVGGWYRFLDSFDRKIALLRS